MKFKIQRIRGDVEELYKPGASLFGQSVRRPIANARAMNVYRYAVLVRSKNSLHFVFAEGVQEIGEAKGSILDWTSLIFIQEKWESIKFYLNNEIIN